MRLVNATGSVFEIPTFVRNFVCLFQRVDPPGDHDLNFDELSTGRKYFLDSLRGCQDCNYAPRGIRADIFHMHSLRDEVCQGVKRSPTNRACKKPDSYDQANLTLVNCFAAENDSS